jgi:peptidoglycan/LPS O-acetylase OafA/YrhL
VTDDGEAALRPVNPVEGGDRCYLRQFDLYRVIACVCVVAQHSVLWPVPGGSVGGWSLVMVLHATRNVFFLLAALVASYSQLLRPRSVRALWYRRLSQVVVAYLAWTLIYAVYTTVKTALGFSAALSALGHDLYSGYYQLYFLVVLFQVYLVLPGLLWLVRTTRGHHGWVLGTSLGLQLAMMTVSHYFSWHTGALHDIRAIDLRLLTSRLIVGYQLYVVAGALAAAHFGDVQRVLERHSTRILWVVLGIGLATEGYYFAGIAMGETPGHASDLFQPVAVVWFLAAAAGLAALGWRWARRAATREPTRWDRLVTWGSDASGGFYLGHVLVLQLLFSGLAAEGLTAHSTWAAAAVVLWVGTLAGTAVLVGILLRTPLRFVLTGPNRTRQRATFPWYPEQALSDRPERPVSSEPARGVLAEA